MNIFVGNLGNETSEKQLETLFTPFGEIRSVKIIKDGFTGRSRGFAFVEMTQKNEAEKAIASLNNSEHNGQTLTVNEARVKNSEESFGRRRN